MHVYMPLIAMHGLACQAKLVIWLAVMSMFMSIFPCRVIAWFSTLPCIFAFKRHLRIIATTCNNGIGRVGSTAWVYCAVHACEVMYIVGITTSICYHIQMACHCRQQCRGFMFQALHGHASICSLSVWVLLQHVIGSPWDLQ